MKDFCGYGTGGDPLCDDVDGGTWKPKTKYPTLDDVLLFAQRSGFIVQNNSVFCGIYTENISKNLVMFAKEILDWNRFHNGN